MDKIIKISTKMDTAEFDRAIDAMQKKMRQISAPSEAAKGFISAKERLATAGVGGGATEADRQRAARMEKESQDRAIRFAKEQGQLVEKANKLYDQREARIKQINEEISKGAKNELELKQKITQLEEQKAKAAETSLKAAKEMNEALEKAGIRAPVGGAGAGGGGYSGGIFGGGVIPPGGGGILRTLGLTIPAIISMAGGAASAIGNIGSSLAANQRIGNVAQGNAIQGLVGEQVANIFSGNNIENLLFAGQRKTALTAARKEEDSQRFFDPFKLAGGALGRIGGGAAAGAGVGAVAGGLIGSLVPFVGTAVGAAVGAKLGTFAGGGLGAGVAGYDVATDPMKRSMLFDRETYNKLSAQREAAGYQQQYQAELMKNPMYVQAAKAFQARAPQELQLQRTMGLTDEQMRGFSEAGTFSRQQMIEASAGILGAGGSTRAARESAFFTNSMQRQYDLTNAPQLIGRLSGAMGGAAESQSALMKMLSESFAIGLDSSEFREENRKFLGVASEMVYRAGAGSQGAAAITGMFGGFVADKTGRGLEAAQTAMQTMSNLATQTGGARGALGAQAALKEGFGKLPVALQDAVQTIEPNELESEAATPLLGAIADKMGISVDEVKKKIRRVKEYKQTATGESEKELKKLRKMKGMGIYSPEYIKKQQAIVGAYAGREAGLKGINEQMSYATGVSEMTESGELITKGAKGIAAGVGISTERAPDKMNEAIAAQDRAASAQIRLIADTLKESLGTSAEEVNKFTEALNEAIQALRGTQRDKAKDALQSATDMFSKLFSVEEPKAGAK